MLGIALQHSQRLPAAAIARPRGAAVQHGRLGARHTEPDARLRRQSDPWSANAGWTKGTHNVKFGFDVQRNYLNHYETQAPVFTFNGGATALSGGTSPE